MALLFGSGFFAVVAVLLNLVLLAVALCIMRPLHAPKWKAFLGAWALGIVMSIALIWVASWLGGLSAAFATSAVGFGGSAIPGAVFVRRQKRKEAELLEVYNAL